MASAAAVAVRAAAASPLPIPPDPRSKPTKITSYPAKQKQKKQQKQKPSIAEIERAIGVAADPFRPSSGDSISSPSSSSSSSSTSPFMEFLASTPIGRAESAAERKLREAAEWVVERTEAQASNGQRILAVVCLKILPVWLLLVLISSGAVNLPFDIPFVDDLLS